MLSDCKYLQIIYMQALVKTSSCGSLHVEIIVASPAGCNCCIGKKKFLYIWYFRNACIQLQSSAAALLRTHISTYNIYVHIYLTKSPRKSLAVDRRWNAAFFVVKNHKKNYNKKNFHLPQRSISWVSIHMSLKNKVTNFTWIVVNVKVNCFEAYKSSVRVS